MAIPVARVHLAMAHGALPGLLPTPPELKKTAPALLPTPPCAVVLPKPAGRADAVERWDACKNTLLKSSSTKPGRADAAERWDARKITPQASSAWSSGSSQQRSSSPDSKSSSASTCERWDSNKKSASTSSSSSSSSSILAKPKRDGSKRPVSRGSSSSVERWDAHKKPRPPLALQGDAVDDDNEYGECSSTGSNDMEVDSKPQPLQLGFYAGPGFLAPPEPSMLPMPSFLVRPRCIVAA